MDKNSKIVVFGSGGLIGKQLVRQLETKYFNVLSCSHQNLDLTNQHAVNEYFEKEKPEYVFFCAVKAINNFEANTVGDGEEIYANVMMQSNVMQATMQFGTKKTLLLGSSMLYPWNLKDNITALNEKQLDEFNFNGYRKSMQSAVLSKFFGYKMSSYFNQQYGDKYVYCLPTHIYGGFANRKNLYFLENIVSTICDAKINKENSVFLDIFGAGKAKKQFLHVSDCADALITIMESYDAHLGPINVTTPSPICWSSIVEKVCQIVNYDGKVSFNSDKVENMSNRLCSTKKLDELGWYPRISIDDGLKRLCEEYMIMKGYKDVNQSFK